MRIPYYDVKLMSLKCGRTYMTFNGEIYEIKQYHGLDNCVCNQCHFYEGKLCDTRVTKVISVKPAFLCESADGTVNFPVERSYLSKVPMNLYLSIYLKYNIKYKYEIDINGYTNKVESYHSRI